MKTIIRNFLTVILHFKMATILNITGLSVAFAAFMVIMIQVDYDRNFDRFHTNYDKIYRLEFVNEGKAQAVLNRPFSELFITSSPHILAGALSSPWNQKIFFHIELNGVRHFYEEDMEIVSPDYTNVFTFDIVEGTKDALKNPDQVIIPISLSRRIFGDQSAVGQRLVSRDKSCTVGAVYRDFPSNSVVNNAIYFPLSEDENTQNWNNWNYQVFLRVDDASNVPQLFENFKQHFDAKAHFGADFTWENSNIDLRLTALPDIHYITNVNYDYTPKASKQTLLVLFAIAIIIIIIAGINFTNFSTALTPMRIKSINTQKVLGGVESTIRISIVCEAIFISLLSYVLSIGLVIIFNHTTFSTFVDADLSVASHPFIFCLTALIALFTGFFAGLYPARYMTSFPPALVLKGSFGLSPKGRKFRNALISVQFIASFALIISAVFMYLQNYYMQHSPLGYDKDELIITNINPKLFENKDAFTDQLKSFSGIEKVTYSESILSSSDTYMGWGRQYKDKQIVFQVIPVDYNFLDVMGIEITAGRDFIIADKNSKYGTYIFNEMARNIYDLELGSTIDSAAIVGFIPDIKFASFRTEVTPMAFYVWGLQNWGARREFAHIKVSGGSDLRAAVSHVRATLSNFDPDYPFDIKFYDAVLQQLYGKENSLSSLISLFSLIAIFISMVGVFGLVVFDSEYKKKEIGLRKVLGSTTREILILFNKTYIRILLICFLIAAPFAWYAVHEWLKNFVYRTPMYWWVYLVSFLIISIITIFTVTFQNWRAANENPVKSIKSE